MRDLLMAKKLCYDQHAPKFQRIFGIRLRPYWDMLTGFNVVKFDEEFVKPADGTSTRDAVLAQWGEEGVDLIVALMG
jgi:hypothetical protein